VVGRRYSSGARRLVPIVLELTQAAAEGELLLVVDPLVVEDQDGVHVHSGMDGRHVVWGEGLGHVHAFDFGREARADLARDDGHRWIVHQDLLADQDLTAAT